MRAAEIAWRLVLAALAVAIVAAAAALVTPAVASAQVWPLERGQPAPASGILLDDATAERAAAALNQADTLRAELELVKAKLSTSDARVAELLVQVDALRQAAEAQTAQLGELKAALERSAERDERIAKVLEETAKTLERSRRELEAVGKKSPWGYVWDAVKVLGALLPFLLLAMR